VTATRAVLVTGGTGFLGRAVASHLRDAGYDTRCLQRSAGSRAGIAAVSGDVRDHVAVARAVDGMDAVIHTAGLAHVFHGSRDAEFADINGRGTETVARAALSAGVRHFILVSSVAVYGGVSPGATEDAPVRPFGLYAVSKAEAERRGAAVFERASTRLTILRMGTLYGEGDRGNVQRLLRMIGRGRFVWIGAGTNRKSLLHVGDAARACVLPLEDDGEPIEIYNVTAPPVTMRTVVEELARGLGRRAPSWHIPATVALAVATAARALAPHKGRVLHDTLVTWLRDEVYSADKFAARFRFEPRVAVAEGLRAQAAGWRRSPVSSPAC
jgi:nucleoside-diphosphate-sugar epimerase